MVRLIYRASLLVYLNIARLAALWNPKARAWIRGTTHALSEIKAKIRPSEKYIWMHVASLGEYEQGKPVLDELLRQYPRYRACITFFSPSGYKVIAPKDQNCLIAYLPLDSPSNASSFLDLVNPELAIFVKYDFWYFYMDGLESGSIPMIILAGYFRKDQWYFRPYGKFMLEKIKGAGMILTQDETSLEVLQSEGIKNSLCTGDTKVDRVIENMQSDFKLGMTPEYEKGIVLVAGSTWPEDEKVIIPWVNRSDDGVIIAPHEIAEERIEEISSAIERQPAKFSQRSPVEKTPGVLIVDSIGSLKFLYRYGSIAYIGGGFGKGIHNILEAAVYGIPVIFGPHYKRFPEAEELIRLGAAFSVRTAEEFSAVMKKLESPDIRENIEKVLSHYFREKKGAAGRVLQWIAGAHLLDKIEE